MIDSFSISEESLTLTQLVERTELPKGTLHRLLGDLVTWGVLERSSAGYRLGLRLFELGQQVPRQRILREAALPHLEDLYLATQEVVHLGIVDGVDVLYVEKLVGHRTAESPSRSGGRMPLYCTAIGKALLAFSPERILDQVIEKGLRPRTPFTIATPSVLRSELEQIRQRRVACEREESAYGLGCMAAPIFGPGGHLVAAVSVSVPMDRYHPQRLGPPVRITALALSRTLGAAV